MNSTKKIVILGPAHPLRGGLASYDERLAREFQHLGWDTHIYTFSLQYPGFLFPGTTQYSSEPAPVNLNIHIRVNSVNPLNWWSTGRELRKLRPDIIVVRYWLPFMGPCLGTICRIARKNKWTRIVCIADNVIPHEKRPGDKIFTKYFLKSVDGFITMSEKVLQDLQVFAPGRPARFIPHPLYDNFGDKIPKPVARQHLGLNPQDKIILFFGFIRRYKGLDLLLQSMASPGLRASGIKLLIAGEFYEDARPYLKQIHDLNLQEQVILRTEFIPDSEVKYYLCAADCVVQPYRSATQSGVTPLAYHFERPMIVTDVGGLPSLVPHGKVGLVAAANPESIAESILSFYKTGEEHFIAYLKEEKKRFSWSRMAEAITEMAGPA